MISWLVLNSLGFKRSQSYMETAKNCCEKQFVSEEWSTGNVLDSVSKQFVFFIFSTK